MTEQNNPTETISETETVASEPSEAEEIQTEAAHSLEEEPEATEPAPTFAELGVLDPIVQRLKARGFERPFSIQTLVMADALEGRDILGKAKTGSGKTLAFSIPMVQRMKPGVTGTQALVLVPTRELATQVADEVRTLCSKNARVVAVYGGAGMKQQMAEAPAAHILVATPGRLIDLAERGFVKLGNVHILVIDEADRMADMGFLPQVGQILRQIPRERQTMLFSATLDAQIMGLIAQTDDAIRHEVEEKTVAIEAITHHLFEVNRMDKEQLLINLLESAPDDLVLVFVNTKVMCDRLARSLGRAGIKAVAIHGDMQQNARERSLSDFEAGKCKILVATDVAARGLDIDDVAMVVNFDAPDDHKTYLHRVGRTARAGRTGIAVTFATWQERVDVEAMAKRLQLQPHIVEMVSSDERISQVATGELEGATHKEKSGDREGLDIAPEVYNKMARRRSNRGVLPSRGAGKYTR